MTTLTFLAQVMTAGMWKQFALTPITWNLNFFEDFNFIIRNDGFWKE